MENAVWHSAWQVVSEDRLGQLTRFVLIMATYSLGILKENYLPNSRPAKYKIFEVGKLT